MPLAAEPGAWAEADSLAESGEGYKMSKACETMHGNGTHDPCKSWCF